MSFVAFGTSDKGRIRPHNEDAFLVDQESGVFAVADGMGGHAAGEVASRLAVEAVREVFENAHPDVEVPALVISAVERANRRIAERIREHPEYAGMGTTLVLARIEADRLILAHVGDSRGYRIRGGQIEQLTSDHSFVNELVRLGMLSKEQAARDPRRNVVTRALGSGPSVVPDVIQQQLEPGDTLLLCSDGLNSMIADELILSTVEAHRDQLDQCCARLVEAANAAGGEDNVTVVAIAFAGAPEAAITAENDTEAVEQPSELPPASSPGDGSPV